MRNTHTDQLGQTINSLISDNQDIEHVMTVLDAFDIRHDHGQYSGFHFIDYEAGAAIVTAYHINNQWYCKY